jgi:hypothetical protein
MRMKYSHCPGPYLAHVSGIMSSLAHFHAYYGEYQASFSISPPNLLTGMLPQRQLRLVLAWAELYQADLEENWQRLQDGRLPSQIPGI